MAPDGKLAVRRESRLSREDWDHVYDAFQYVGTPSAIATRIGMTAADVQYLLEHGISRLGLPAIRIHAVDQGEVALQLRDSYETRPAVQTLPEVQEAATARVARESETAQRTLDAGVVISATLLSFANKVSDALEAGAVDLTTITPRDFSELSKAAKSLVDTVDKALRLSRFAAGEPDQAPDTKVVVHAVANITDKDRDNFLQHMRLPSMAAASQADAAASDASTHVQALRDKYIREAGTVREDTDTDEG